MKQDLKWNIELLKEECTQNNSENNFEYNAARGIYSSKKFVLSLRSDVQNLLANVNSGIVSSNDLDFETIQAFSTYFHETIHWWQHIGSISGFISSLSYPAQAHINYSNLKKYLNNPGAIKPIIQYNEIYGSECLQGDEKFKNINIILNNFHDIEFFNYRVLIPNSVKKISSNPFFESIGHSFHITYSSFLNLLASTFDRELKFLPNFNEWGSEFQKLQENKIDGYYLGSPIGIPPIGLREMFEGQARFSQLQYLFLASGEKLTWADFNKAGLLSGIYFSAFSCFVELTESAIPKTIMHPLVGLFLLVLDLSMNPNEGFPFNIIQHETFIYSTDPGYRFFLFCRKIAKELPELKYAIKNYSTTEYEEISAKLCKATFGIETSIASKLFKKWAKEQASIQELFEEEKSFEFKVANKPIRLLFSQFLKYQQDKLENPAFFCWPGCFLAGKNCSNESMVLFNKHQALFRKQLNGNVCPRDFPDKKQIAVQDTFDSFYSWIATYDLCRQWIVDKGNFSFDYRWLVNENTINDLEDWASTNFESSFGISPSNFEIL